MENSKIIAIEKKTMDDVLKWDMTPYPSKKFDIVIKPFLGIEEIEYILKCLVEYESGDEVNLEFGFSSIIIGKQVLKDLLLLKICTNITEYLEDSQILSNEFYDKAIQSGLMQEVKSHILNLHVLEEKYEEAMTFTNLVKYYGDKVMALSKTAIKGLPKTKKGWDKFIDKIIKAVDLNGNNINGGSDSDGNGTD